MQLHATKCQETEKVVVAIQRQSLSNLERKIDPTNAPMNRIGTCGERTPGWRQSEIGEVVRHGKTVCNYSLRMSHMEASLRYTFRVKFGLRRRQHGSKLRHERPQK